MDKKLISHHNLPRAERKKRKYTLGQYMARLAGNVRQVFSKDRIYKPSLNYFRTSGTVDIAHGAGGVLVRPRFFDAAVFDVPEYAFHVDDVWISGHLALTQTPIWVDHRIQVPRETEVSDNHSLVELEVAHMNRKKLNQRCAQKMAAEFGIWGGVKPA